MLISFLALFYKHVAKRLFFLFDAEKVHSFITTVGETIGNNNELNKIFNHYFGKKSSEVRQKLSGIEFKSPVGLAAGFDYEAKVVKILPAFGFGFNSVGTITNYEYKGNSSPMLGRLPRSKSLMVNKGFKNRGALWTAKNLGNKLLKSLLELALEKQIFHKLIHKRMPQLT